jgi:serine protease
MWSFVKNARATGLSLVLVALLVSCPPPVARVEYKLLSVLPTPVTPGDVVTAFGVFPASAQVMLGQEVLNTTPVKDGLRFTVPASVLAQDANIEILGTAPWGETVKLVGGLAVNPRIDAAAVQGRSVRVVGTGWNASSVLKVNGRVIPATLDGQALLGELPQTSAFGLLTVTVEVGKRVSNPKGVLFEAGAIQGRVSLPVVQPTLLNPQGLRRSVQQPSEKAFIVNQAAAAQVKTLVSATRVQTLVGLDAVRFEFSTPELAQTASGLLQKVGILVEWDHWIGVQNAPQGIPSHPPQRTRLSRQAGSVPTPSPDQWFLNLLEVSKAWQVNQGAGITVAVIDTGVNLEHPDLKANLLPGYDFVDEDNIPQDIAGHGTHVAGLVAANGKALGIAPQAKILPIRVLRDLSGGSTSTVAQGILWAANLLTNQPNPHPAQVINLSLGSNDYSPLLDSAIQQVQARGVVVVAAAGNNGGAVAFPAALRDVVAVTALAGVRGGDLLYQPSYASRGPGVWVTAFGGDLSQDQDQNGVPDGILSTDLGETGYGLRMGTSMAAPQVAGLAALALANGLQATMIRSILATTATDLGIRGVDLQFGYGLVSARAITYSQPRLYAVALDTSGAVVSWSLVQTDGSFLLQNLTPNQDLSIFVASDENQNNIVGEVSEWRTTAVTHQAMAARITEIDRLELYSSNQSGVRLALVK